MARMFVENTAKIKKLKKEIEKALNVSIKISDEIDIEGKDAFNEYLAEKVIDALEHGFNLEQALKLRNEDYMISKINLKKFVRPSRLKAVVGRIIGEKGRTKEIIMEMTGCDIAVHDYNVAVIGDTEDVEIALHALRSLIGGSPHASVYAYLERNRKFRKYREEDLGLKKAFKKK